MHTHRDARTRKAHTHAHAHTHSHTGTHIHTREHTHTNTCAPHTCAHTYTHTCAPHTHTHAHAHTYITLDCGDNHIQPKQNSIAHIPTTTRIKCGGKKAEYYSV